jgi:hypothetical protein
MVEMKGGPAALGLNGFLGQMVDVFVNDPLIKEPGTTGGRSFGAKEVTV